MELNFERDEGVRRSTMGAFNLEKAEELLKSAREYMEKEAKATKSSDVKARLPFIEVCKALGINYSRPNNLVYEFSPSNPRGAFRSLALKYRIKVGSHKHVMSLEDALKIRKERIEVEKKMRATKDTDSLEALSKRLDELREPAIYFREMTVAEKKANDIPVDGSQAQEEVKSGPQ